LGCAVGCAVMDVVNTTEFLDAVNETAARFEQGIESLIDAHPMVFDSYRGKGLMIGIKCKVTNLDVVKAGYEHGLLTVPAGDNVIRLLPPLNITHADISATLEKLDQAALSLNV